MNYPKYADLAPADQAQAHEYSIARACIVALNGRKPPTAAGPEPEDRFVPPRKYTQDKTRPPASGVRYVYRNRNLWQVRIPGMETRCFKIDELDLAQAYVTSCVEDV